MENQKGIVEVVAEKVWKFFSSVKLAVVLLIILAIVSVIGTVIQQNEAPEKYLREYSQSAVNLFEFLGFFDMYHTWWFVLLLFLFTANLTVCTLERLPHSLRIITAPLKPIEDDGLKAVPFKKEITFKGGMDKAEERAAKVLHAHRYRFVESREPGTSQFMTQKGVYSRLGVYITHTSIILIFTGALIGSFFGFKAFLNLPEGSASKVVYLRNEPMWDRLMDALGIAGSPVIPNPQGGVPSMPIGFYVRCDSFDVDYYINQSGMPTGMPSEYHSTLSVYDLNEQKILEKRIRVNDPLSHHGITFYQSSYGTVPNGRGKVILNVRPKNNPGSASPRAIRILRHLAFSVTILVFLYYLRQIAAGLNRPSAAPLPALEFRLVETRYSLVRPSMTRGDVERLLGPPTEIHAWGPELEQFEEGWWNSGRNWFPKERIWHRWSDPDDVDRWVAVVYTGRYPDETIYGKLKKGF